MNNRAFTFKSVITGCILCLGIVFFAEKTRVLGQYGLSRNYLPSISLFLILLLSLPWNGIVGKFLPKMRFSKRELVVVIGMLLVTSWVPSFMSRLVPQMILPQVKGQIDRNWKEAETLSRLPPSLFPQSADEDLNEVISLGFLQGLGTGSGLSDVPLSEWVSPGLKWGLLLFFLLGALLSLTIVVHRQWSHHEQLRYPLASVLDSLLKQDEKKGFGMIFTNPLFWLGFVPVFGMTFFNYLGIWFPGALPKIAMEYTLKWEHLFPIIRESGIFNVQWYNVYFMVIGISYFIPSDTSLSVGLTPLITVILGVQFYLLGGTPLTTGDLSVLRAGGYIGFLLIILYTGKTFYIPIFLKALGIGAKVPNEDGAVMAARTFMLAYAGLVVLLYLFGLDWLMSLLYVSLLLTMFLVITRLVCETGMPTLVPGWVPMELLLKLLGPGVIGSGSLIFMHYLGSILTGGSGGINASTMMPYLATTSKLGEDNGFKINRFLLSLHVVVVLAVVVGFVATIYHLYLNGVSSHFTNELDSATRQMFMLKERGILELSGLLGGFSKFSLLAFDKRVFSFFILGLLAVVITYLIRFRSTKWPFHPLIFVVMGSYSLSWTWFSFLLGWSLKSVIVKVSGSQSYIKYKPFFMGLIVADAVMIALSSVISLLSYYLTGEVPSVN